VTATPHLDKILELAAEEVRGYERRGPHGLEEVRPSERMVWVSTTSHRSRQRLQMIVGDLGREHGVWPKDGGMPVGSYFQVPAHHAEALKKVSGLKVLPGEPKGELFRRPATNLHLAADASEDEHSGPDLGDEDRSDWDETDWDDVRSHLESQSPWFKRVIGGESPGEPDADDIKLTPRTAEASTVHEPTVPPGGPGLFHMKGHQLPPYVQHLYKHLVGKYGKHRAYGVAIGIVKKWAKGINPGGKGKGHKVHSDVQAAAGKNVAEWEKEKAEAHAHHGEHGDHKSRDKAAASNVELSTVRAFERDVQGRMEHVNSYIKDNRLKIGVIGPESPLAKTELTGLYRSSKEDEAAFRGHLRDARAHYAAGRHEDAKAALGSAQEVARSHSLNFAADALEKQKQAIDAERGRAIAKAQTAVPMKQRRGLLGHFGHRPGMVAASHLETVLGLAAPASWPSGKPYKESLLPPGPTTGLKQGQQTRTGVIVNAPGTKPALYGQLRQAPAQTVSPSPPLPPGAKLPEPKDLVALTTEVPTGPDVTLDNSIKEHLRTAAGKLESGASDEEVISALRGAQTGVHAAYRAAYAENLPVSMKAYGINSLVPPAEQSSATTAMLKGREVTEGYRKLHHKITGHIDTLRRHHFHGMYQGMPEARFAGRTTPMGEIALAQVHGYERENRFGRIVNVSGYMREGKPYTGKLVGDEADEAIKAGVARGEFGEPTGYFQTSDGKKMWGWYGAAGLLVRHRGADGTRYLLQKRAPWVDDGNTYSVPGGALDAHNGVPESPVEGAVREGREEGMELPEGTTHAETRSNTFGEGKGAWSYHTVVMDTPRMFTPGSKEAGGSDTTGESRGYVWATPQEMADLPLHPHFRATAESLGMPKGGGTRPPEQPGFDPEKMFEAGSSDKEAGMSRTTTAALSRVLEAAGVKHK